MEVRPEIQIRAMIKAMVDVVLPAVDARHMMAQEQARLVIATLRLIADRLPVAYRFDRDQVSRYVALAREILALDEAGADRGHASSGLASLMDRGDDVLRRARAEPSELESTAFELRAEVSRFLQSFHERCSPEQWVKMKALMLDAAKLEVERERALVVAMGFEADARSLPPIDRLLPRVDA